MLTNQILSASDVYSTASATETYLIPNPNDQDCRTGIR